MIQLPGQMSSTPEQQSPRLPLLLLKDIQVANPCSADWEGMAGDDRVRLCAQCQLHVYNLSEMTETEAQSLILEKEGRLCVRFYRRIDGTVLTRDCPVGLTVRSWRLIYGVGAAAFALLAGMVAMAFQQTTSPASRSQSVFGRSMGGSECVQGGVIPGTSNQKDPPPPVDP